MRCPKRSCARRRRERPRRQIISYNAANVPVAQLNIFSDTLSGQQLFDYGLNFVRLQLFTIPGFSSPAPLGGVQRAVVVNLDPKAMYADNLSPVDIGNALATTNVVIPSGTARMGNYEYNVDLNMSPSKVAEFNRLPVRFVSGAPIFLGDVAPVSDTHQPQTNVVRVDGRPGTLLLVIKHAAASTLAVVDAVRARLPDIHVGCAARNENLADLRSVGLRSLCAVGGCARSGHGRNLWSRLWCWSLSARRAA